MPSIESGIVTLLNTLGYPVSAFPMASGTPYPFITYERASTQYVDDLGGSAGLAKPVFAIKPWADKNAGGATKANAVAQQIIDLIQGLTDTANSVYILDVRIVNDHGMYDDIELVWCRVLDCEISHH